MFRTTLQVSVSVQWGDVTQRLSCLHREEDESLRQHMFIFKGCSEQTRQTQIQSLETLLSRRLIILDYSRHSHLSRLTLRGKKTTRLCWSECKQPYVSDVVGLNSSLIGCRGTMPPEKLDIVNFICVASVASVASVTSDAPDASFSPRYTLHWRRCRRLNHVSMCHLHWFSM